MNVSKVSFFKDTQDKLTSSPMTMKQKGRLRRKRVKDYIREQPAGADISTKDLIFAAGYAADTPGGYSNGWAFIDKMKKRGDIDENKNVDKSVSTWTIPGDTRTITPPRKTQTTPKPESEPKQQGIQLPENWEQRMQAGLLAITVEQKAREFAWAKGSNDLREFVKFIKEEI